MPRKWHRFGAETGSCYREPAFSLFLSLSLSLFPARGRPSPSSRACRPCAAAQRASTSRSRATDDTSESSLYMVGPSPSGRRPVNGRDSLFTDGISGRRTNGWPSGRRGEEPRKRYRDRSLETFAERDGAHPVAPRTGMDIWRPRDHRRCVNQNFSRGTTVDS